MAKKAKGGNSKKIGRQKKKNLRRGSPVSQYARGLITFDQYLKLTGIKASK